MILDLLDLFGGVSKTLPFKHTFDADGLYRDIKKCTVNAEGQIRNFAGYVVLTAGINVKAQVVCGRCCKEFETELCLDIEQKLTDKLENEEDEFILVEAAKLDLEDFLRSSIILELPARFVCSGDCKGLCPKCGISLNDSQCSCNKKDIDPRLAVLSDFFEEE
jgi:uncharacterized protein